MFIHVSFLFFLTKVRNIEQFSKRMQLAAKKLNIAPHVAGMIPETAQVLYG